MIRGPLTSFFFAISLDARANECHQKLMKVEKAQKIA